MPQRVLDFLSRPEVWGLASALIGFLTLTWVLRGAPLGQAAREEPEGAPGPGYRDRVVTSAVVGFLLVVVGAYLATSVSIPWSLPAFAAGFGIVLSVLHFNRKYRHDSPTMRRVLEFSDTALTASLISGILIVGNVVAFKYGGRPVDLTRDGTYSLSSQSLSVLQSLDRPTSFTVFFGNSEGANLQLGRVRQLLELYRAANPSKIKVDYLDSTIDYKEFESLARRIPGVASAQGGVVVSYGEGEGVPMSLVTTLELFEGPGGRFEAGPNRVVSTFNGEDVMTSALIRLREGKRTRVAFTKNHGELSAGEFDPSQPGVGLWRARLSSVGLDVVELDLLKEAIPDDVSLLVVCGPRTPFKAEEVEKFRPFVIRGGQFLVLVGDPEKTGLDDFLRSYNVELGRGMVVDLRLNHQRRPSIVAVPIPQAPGQPIVGPLAGRYVLVPAAAPLLTLGGPPKPTDPPGSKPSNPAVSALPILRTGPESWAESTPGARPLARDPAKEPAAPVVGVAVSIRPQSASERPTPRMVVLSGANLADNTSVQIQPTNLDLLMNAVYWLRGRPEMQGIQPKTQVSLLFAADPGLRLRLVMIPTLLAVIVIIGLGGTTYLARRD